MGCCYWWMPKHSRALITLGRNIGQIYRYRILLPGKQMVWLLLSLETWSDLWSGKAALLLNRDRPTSSLSRWVWRFLFLPGKLEAPCLKCLLFSLKVLVWRFLFWFWFLPGKLEALCLKCLLFSLKVLVWRFWFWFWFLPGKLEAPFLKCLLIHSRWSGLTQQMRQWSNIGRT